MSRFDLISLCCIGFILLAGLAALYGLAATSDEPLFARQLLYAAMGLLLFAAAAFTDYRLISAYARHFLVIAVLLLLAVLMFGQEIRGSARWLQVAGLSFQPVEFAKVALIIVLARFFAKKRGEVKNAMVLVHSGLFALILTLLVILQPDLGSAVIIVAVWCVMLLLAPVRKAHVAALIIIIAGVSLTAWHGIPSVWSGLHDYQKERIVSFLDPEHDPLGSGYNVRQSIIAVGSGQIWGRGLGKGYQSHLRFLPERHTDFIFASFAEELGFIGSLLLLTAFAVLLWRLYFIAIRARDALGLYIVLGTAALIALQLFVNVGMNLGLVPATGIPLPLLSYGGSSLLATLFLLGMAQNVYYRNRSGI